MVSPRGERGVQLTSTVVGIDRLAVSPVGGVATGMPKKPIMNLGKGWMAVDANIHEADCACFWL